MKTYTTVKLTKEDREYLKDKFGTVQNGVTKLISRDKKKEEERE